MVTLDETLRVNGVKN